MALDRMPPRRRAILILHEIEGTGIADIARLTGVAAVTVRWHLSVGRRQMATILKGRVLMADWQELLREPPRRAARLRDEAGAIRRLAIAAGGGDRRRGPVERRSPMMVIGSMLVTAVTAGILVARSATGRGRNRRRLPSPAVVRQLQFATPGGRGSSGSSIRSSR